MDHNRSEKMLCKVSYKFKKITIKDKKKSRFVTCNVEKYFYVYKNCLT